MKVGEKINFSYTGTPQEFIVPVDGIYKLEVWGGQGGDTYWNSLLLGGRGGYASGYINLAKGTNLHIYVGGQGQRCITKSRSGGGFNGGGGAYYHQSGNTTNAFVGGGGGATDIRINLDSLNHRVIVAGGGGGSGYDYDGTTSYGGGTSGGSSDAGSWDRLGNGGTQTAGGSTTYSSSATSGTFGAGGYGTGTWVAGGGGGWYGGSACYCGNAGGGSGYVLTETSYKPSGYALTSEHYLTDTQLIGGNQSMPSTTGGTQTGQVGNGFARITLIESFASLNARCKVDGVFKNINSMKVKVNGVWKEVTQVKSKIDGVWK